MATTPLTLDPRQTEEAVPALVAAFAALAPGDALILETPSDPRRLARPFSEVAWGQFDWAPLETGDGHWRTEVRKRTAPGPDCISGFLGEDHKRCDALYADAESAAQADDAGQAARLFAAFHTGMTRHLAMEEEGLFPELEQRMGFFGQGPTTVMREEHEQMRGLFARMEAFLPAGELEGFMDACETLLILMEQHNMKEEEMLYPMMDDAFAGEEEALLKQLITY
ncbi:MAG TPA: hemerythrin domain-containing protein [bacterium]|nr:hemerythrin domain-containing protein [bacterium]